MKKLCYLLVLIMLLSVFAGCTKDGGEKGVEISVASNFDSTNSNGQNFINAYKAYETASGNKIKDLAKPSDEAWKSDIVKSFKEGTEPDVLFYFVGADADEIINAGKVVSISDIRKVYSDYAKNMKDSLIPVATDGKQYAVPVNGFWEGMFVNTKVLADSKVEIPGADYTWEQFIKDCEKIKAAGFTPIAASLMQIPHYWFEFTVFNNGNTLNHLDIPANGVDEAGQKWVKGISDIKELYDKGFFPADTLTATDGETNKLMLSDNAAFMIDGSWKIGWFREPAEDIETDEKDEDGNFKKKSVNIAPEGYNPDNFTVTYVPAKGDRKATEIIGGLSQGYYISKKAWDDPAKQKACVDFIIAMTKDEVVNTFAGSSLSITALQNGTKTPENPDALALSAITLTKNCTAVIAPVQDKLSVAAKSSLFFDDITKTAGDIKKLMAGDVSAVKAVENCITINNK